MVTPAAHSTHLKAGCHMTKSPEPFISDLTMREFGSVLKHTILVFLGFMFVFGLPVAAGLGIESSVPTVYLGLSTGKWIIILIAVTAVVWPSFWAPIISDLGRSLATIANQWAARKFLLRLLAASIIAAVCLAFSYAPVVTWCFLWLAIAFLHAVSTVRARRQRVAAAS